MSATGRVRVVSEALPPPVGTAYPEGTTLRAVTRTKRAKGDFYETPTWCIDAILPHLLPIEVPGTLIVDAGAGTGAIAARIASRTPSAEVVGVEKNGDHVEAARARGLYSAEFVTADFEKWTPETGTPDLVVMNPPYSRAVEFVNHALSIVKRCGTVAALLRLSWLAGKSRRDFHKRHAADVYVLTKRPSFTGNGATDACDYAWFVWGPDRGNRWYPLNYDDKAKRKPRASRKISNRNASPPQE